MPSAPWGTEWRITPWSHTHKGLFTFPVTSFPLGTVDAEAVLPSGSSRKNKGWPAFIYTYGKVYEQDSTSCLLPHSNIQMQFENGATETYLQRPVFCLKIQCESITLGYSSPPVHRWLMIPELLLQHLCLGHLSNQQMYAEYLLCMGNHCNAMSGMGRGVTFSFPKDPIPGGKKAQGWGAEKGLEEEWDGSTLHTSPRLVLSLVRKHPSMRRGKPPTSFKGEEIAAPMAKLTRSALWVWRMQSWPFWFPRPALGRLPHRRAKLHGVGLS